MNTLTITFSILSLWSLIAFNRKGKRFKFGYGVLAYCLILFFGIQLICVTLLDCNTNPLQAVLTVILSIPLLACEGNVAEACRSVKNYLKDLYEIK